MFSNKKVPKWSKIVKDRSKSIKIQQNSRNHNNKTKDEGKDVTSMTHMVYKLSACVYRKINQFNYHWVYFIREILKLKFEILRQVLFQIVSIIFRKIEIPD